MKQDAVSNLMSRTKVGIFGGTFDPIHIGHLIIANIVRQECNLNKVIFIPTGNPPHKTDHVVTPACHRYTMANIAIRDNSHFEISPIEINREGITFTIDTLRSIKQELHNECELNFIIGGDTLLEVRSWKEAGEVMKMSRLIVYQRPGYVEEDVLIEAKRLREQMGASIIFVDGPILEISSTHLRRRITQGKTVKYLLSPGVEQYIKENSLYGSL